MPVRRPEGKQQLGQERRLLAALLLRRLELCMSPADRKMLKSAKSVSDCGCCEVPSEAQL
ncbi:MAG: hypothetical protein AB9879_12205 [Methanothrix sp.]